MTSILTDETYKCAAAISDDNKSTAQYEKYGSRSTVQGKSTHISIKGQYNQAQKIEDLAIQYFRINGRGITYLDLQSEGLAIGKDQAKDTLNYHCYRVENKTLFTLRPCRPQQYFPKSIEPEVRASKLSKSTAITTTVPSTLQRAIKANSLAEVLSRIPFTPLGIHRIQMKTHVDPNEITDCHNIVNNEPLGNRYVTYMPYNTTGTVVIDLACTENPYRLQEDYDVSILFGAIGQCYERLLRMLSDRHERIVPHFMDWRLMACDIGRDIPITSSAHINLPKYNPIELKEVDRVFRLYTKIIGHEPVYRLEESCTLKTQPYISNAITEVESKGNNPDWLKPATDFIGDLN